MCKVEGHERNVETYQNYSTNLNNAGDHTLYLNAVKGRIGAATFPTSKVRAERMNLMKATVRNGLV